MGSLLYVDEYKINDNISIRVPTVGEVIDNEEDYNDMVFSVISTPYDMLVQLDDAGIDFSKISDFELFCLMFGRLQKAENTALIFGELDLTGFQVAINEQNGEIMLIDEQTQVVIDRAIHDRIARFLRKMLRFERNDKKPGNEEARRYLIDKARRKQQREAKKRAGEEHRSQIETLITALVNTEQFPYTYASVREISIYQFYSSLHQIMHKIKYDNTMSGFYAGTIKLDDLSLKDRTWILEDSNKY